MSAPTCSCSRPITDSAALCHPCGEALRYALVSIPAWLARLEVTRSRQSRTSGRNVGVISRSADTPLPWDERASRAGAHLRVELVGAVRVLVEDHPGRLPDDTLGSMAAWLLRRFEQWRRHEAASELFDGLTEALSDVIDVCDREPDKVYLGVCSVRPEAEDGTQGEECPADVYVEVGQMLAYCPLCKAGHDVTKRRAVLAEAVRDQLADVATLSAALSSLDQPVTTSAIRNLVSRKQLVARGHDANGVALYRVGDLADLLTARRQRENDRRTA